MSDRERKLYNCLKLCLLYLCGNGTEEAEKDMIREIQDTLDEFDGN